MILTGKNLCERQREFNCKVNEAAKEKIDFEEVQARTENSDIDILFKIDLASKYKNIDYIIETLKCGDTLYVSRALKCVWLYDDEHASYINPEYIHENIFPFMSSKMKKKLLKTIGSQVKNEKRAATFYHYCSCTANNMLSCANIFLINTSENFKLDLIHKKIEIISDQLLGTHDEHLASFIGTSFTLAEAYLNNVTLPYKNKYLHVLRYLYSVNNHKYLDLLEKHVNIGNGYIFRFGYRLSKDIIKKYRNRTSKNPFIYAHVLHKDALTKYITSEDAKMYAVCLLPNNVQEFWIINYRGTYDYVINAIPFNERHTFLKDIFLNKYPTAEFEMCLQFYTQRYYDGMSTEMQEQWALRHLASQAELLGSDQDYIWYKFVNFSKAFVEIKKFILITPDRNKRSDIVKILIESAKTQNELEQLFNYYYERHVNEDRHYKEDFLNAVYDHHKVFDFEESCWTAYDKILYSMDVYNPLANNYNNTCYHSNISLIYHIIHNKQVPQVLETFVKEQLSTYSFERYINHINEANKEKVYQCVIQIMLKVFHEFDLSDYDENIKIQAETIIRRVQSVMSIFKKPEDEIPDIVTKYMQLNKVFQKNASTLTEEKLICLLKQDSALVINDFSLIEQTIERSYNFRLNQLLRKLKMYFPYEAQQYLEFFKGLLEKAKSIRSIHMAVYGLFQLADESFKIDFMTKYTPTEPKINHDAIDRNHLYIQESICRYVCYSRPPVPLSNVRQFIKGDYLKYCLPMFNVYIANLPPKDCLKFVSSLLDTAVSIQKHGLRLAFKCFTMEELITLISTIWNKSKNVSLRMVLYTSLFNYLKDKDEIQQRQLFDVLKIFTLSLHQDDHDDVIALLTGRSISLPDYLKGEYIKCAWNTVVNFSENMKNTQRRVAVIESIKSNLKHMEQDFVKKLIDEYIHKIFVDKKIVPTEQSIQRCGKWLDVTREMWYLVETYICTYDNEEYTTNLVIRVIKICQENWHEVHGTDDKRVYVFRTFCFEFLFTLITNHYSNMKLKYALINPLFEVILTNVSDALPKADVYLLVWHLKVSIIANKVIDDGDTKLKDNIKEGSDISLKDVILIFKEIAYSYATQVGDLVTEYISKDECHKCLLNEIVVLAERRLDDIISCLVVPTPFAQPNSSDMRIFVASRLTNFKLMEAYFIAIAILPINCTNNSAEDYDRVLSAIEAYGDKEIQYYMQLKIQRAGYKEIMCKRMKLS